MGQCPSNPVPRCDDEAPAESDGRMKQVSCYAALPLQHILPGTRSSGFLKTHQPDRTQKCILDPKEVRQILQIQADEMLARDGHVIPQQNGDENDVLSSPLLFSEDVDRSRFSVPDFLSDVAPSEMTTWSTATRPAQNLSRPVKSKRKQSNKKFSVMDNLSGVPEVTTVDSNDDVDEELAFYNDKQQGSSQQYVVDNMAVASDNLSKIPAERMEQVKSDQSRLFDVYESFLSSWADSQDELLQRKERYASVLQLKMKAHLGYYYTQRYLPLFPEAPAPLGLSSTNIQHKAPHLVPDDSSSSSSSANSQHIDYGSTPPAIQVKSAITNLPFMDLAVTGSLGLVPRRGVNSKRLRSPASRNLKSPDHYLVLINRRSAIPLAVCALKSSKGNPVIRMFATKARVPGQGSAATTRQLGLDWAGNFALYAWAEIVTDGVYPDPVGFSIFMASGSEGRFSALPCYKAELDASDGKPTIKVTGRTDKEVRSRGCALIDVELDDDSNKDEDLVFKMKIAKGIDPALMICFTAVMDEVMEKNMRVHTRGGVPRKHL